jgi:hypothetical protein
VPASESRFPRKITKDGRTVYCLEMSFYIINRLVPTGWLARVRHDLVKRLVWPARDRRDMGGAPAPGELVPQLIDDEGRPATAAAIWTALLEDAPAAADTDTLAAFQHALARAEAAAAAGDLAGVLALEAAFENLARALERRSHGGP